MKLIEQQDHRSHSGAPKATKTPKAPKTSKSHSNKIWRNSSIVDDIEGGSTFRSNLIQSTAAGAAVTSQNMSASSFSSATLTSTVTSATNQPVSCAAATLSQRPTTSGDHTHSKSNRLNDQRLSLDTGDAFAFSFYFIQLNLSQT